MERVPRQKYTKEFREQAVQLVQEVCVAEPPPLETGLRERTARSGVPGRPCAHPADLRTGSPTGGIAERRVPGGIGRIKRLRKK
jgi:hypothetical protein